MDQRNIYSAYHIANNTVEYNPQRKNNFMLIIEGLNNIPRMGAADGTTTDIIRNGQEEILLTLNQCSIPQITQGKLTINRGSSQIKFPGKPEFSDITFRVYDYIGSNIKDTLMAWQNQCYNTTYDYIGNKSAYKKNCSLYEYTPDGVPVRYWAIKGAWPTSVTPDNRDMSDDGEVNISVTLSIDWAELRRPDEE